MSSNQNQKTIVITGCSSGIGYETAIACAKNNFQVFACVRSITTSTKLKNFIEVENISNLKIIEMDVSKKNSIIAGVNQILKHTDQIDILFNNAGKMVIGSLEDLSEDELELQLNTDLIGPILLTQKIIPIMRNNKSGLIINMGSIAGKIGFQLSSPYCISKFGLEGLSESLRRELSPYGIDVCVIEAGIVNTKFFENTRIAEASTKSPYTIDTMNMKTLLDKILKEDFTQPEFVAQEIMKIINEHGKNFRYVIGEDAYHLINASESHKHDYHGMDKEIESIMSKWIK